MDLFLTTQLTITFSYKLIHDINENASNPNTAMPSLSYHSSVNHVIQRMEHFGIIEIIREEETAQRGRQCVSARLELKYILPRS